MEMRFRIAIRVSHVPCVFIRFVGNDQLLRIQFRHQLATYSCFYWLRIYRIRCATSRAICPITCPIRYLWSNAGVVEKCVKSVTSGSLRSREASSSVRLCIMRNILRKPLFLDGVKLCFSPSISMKSGCTCRISCGEHPLSPWTSSAANPCTSHLRCSVSHSFDTDLRQLRIRVCLKMHDTL